VLQIKPTADGKVTEEEIKAIIKEGTEGGRNSSERFVATESKFVGR
jgi:hypothetical protein